MEKGVARRHDSFVRIMTWNIHGGVGPDGRRDLERVIELIQRHDPDIIALQEVDSRSHRHRAEPVFERFAAALGAHCSEARLITAPDGDYGHVVVSRWPFRQTAHHDLSVKGREPRAAIEVTIETPYGLLHLVAAHLGLSLHERRYQTALLTSLARAGPAPSLLLGDFNDWVWRGSVQRALATCSPVRTLHRTFPAWLPLLALDRIYFRPASLLVRSWTDQAARMASDHLPVIADIDMPR